MFAFPQTENICLCILMYSHYFLLSVNLKYSTQCQQKFDRLQFFTLGHMQHTLGFQISKQITSALAVLQG